MQKFSDYFIFSLKFNKNAVGKFKMVMYPSYFDQWRQENFNIPFLLLYWKEKSYKSKKKVGKKKKKEDCYSFIKMPWEK